MIDTGIVITILLFTQNWCFLAWLIYNAFNHLLLVGAKTTRKLAVGGIQHHSMDSNKSKPFFFSFFAA